MLARSFSNRFLRFGVPFRLFSSTSLPQNVQLNGLSKKRQRLLPIAEEFPQILSFWHPSKNFGITPYQFNKRARLVAWWKCPNGPDHEWNSEIRSIIKKNACSIECPFCSDKQLSVTNSLLAKYPEVSKEWNVLKNTTEPSQILWNSKFKVWWRCIHYSEHEWVSSVYDRTLNPTNSGCPKCSKGKTVREERSLSSLFPHIAKQWDVSKNTHVLSPMEIDAFSDKIVWWICERGHSWQASINNRTRVALSQCPICSPRSNTQQFSLGLLYPELSTQLVQRPDCPIDPFSLNVGSRVNVWWMCDHSHAPVVSTPKSLFMKQRLEFLKSQTGPYYWQEPVHRRVGRYNRAKMPLCPHCDLKSKRLFASYRMEFEEYIRTMYGRHEPNDLMLAPSKKPVSVGFDGLDDESLHTHVSRTSSTEWATSSNDAISLDGDDHNVDDEAEDAAMNGFVDDDEYEEEEEEEEEEEIENGEMNVEPDSHHHVMDSPNEHEIVISFDDVVPVQKPSSPKPRKTKKNTIVEGKSHSRRLVKLTKEGVSGGNEDGIYVQLGDLMDKNKRSVINRILGEHPADVNEFLKKTEKIEKYGLDVLGKSWGDVGSTKK